MADITLADYTGYILLELIKAREMTDRHSRQLAEVYAQDPVRRHFSMPRFKVPKTELTISVLVSGARFNQVITLKTEAPKFVCYVMGRLKEVASMVRSRAHDPFRRPGGVAAWPPCLRASCCARQRAPRKAWQRRRPRRESRPSKPRPWLSGNS